MSAAAPNPPAARSGARWDVAQRIGDALRERYDVQLQALGVHGALAHGDDNDASEVNLVVVTRHPGGGPAPGMLRVDGVIVDLSVIDADEYLRHARTLTTSWPITADQYITTKPLHDPDAWLPRLRDTHLARLAGTGPRVFASLAREAWCRAKSAQNRARQLAEWFSTDAAMVVLAEARLSVALVEGLLTRTYFRNGADAVTQAEVAGAHVYELGDRLTAQAQELARRGRPVDGTIADLLG